MMDSVFSRSTQPDRPTWVALADVEHKVTIRASSYYFDDMFPDACYADVPCHFMDVDQRWIDETREEVEHLRSLGLWTAKKRTTPATTIVKWVPAQ